MMTHSDPEGLGRDERKRLDKLADNWTKPADSMGFRDLSAADLRLLLEHFQPLRNLIQDIAATRSSAQGEGPALDAEGPCDSVSGPELAAERDRRDMLPEREPGPGKKEHAELATALQECIDATDRLKLENKALKQQIRQLKDELQHAQQELQCARQPKAQAHDAELTFLRTDLELARLLDLADLPVDDIEALVRVVAVLSQRDNLQRFWIALKDRCEEQDRPANDAELQLLRTSLSWYNYNWRKRPYRLVPAQAGEEYDFERQLRSRHDPAGDSVRELRLSGIADGSGKLLCKPLVRTS